MSVFYRIAYALGLAPWEEAQRHAPARRAIEMIFDREASERGGPGRALDVGCGRGAWSVELARRGWEVVGVDNVPHALRKARMRAELERRRVQFLEVDLTRAPPDELLRRFDFLWDFGAFHGLSPERRPAAGRSLTDMAAPKGTMALLAWRPGRRGPLPRGASRDEIVAAFEGWELVSEEPFDATGLPRALRDVEPRIYRLRLRVGAS
ncbi:MAG: class I SAM-dependent methyltransferase [Pseudomonadota bacterium]